MYRLVIAEKPSVAQTIANVLGVKTRKDGYIEGEGYIVSWCVGHLVGLAYPEAYDENLQSWSFDTLPIIPEEWKFAVTTSTKAQYNVLKVLMSDRRVDEIICATDAGREGECIFRYVYNMAKCKKPVKRLWVSSLEESAIKAGFDNLKPSAELDNLFAAGFARAKADWLVGMNGTRLFSVRYGGTLNIGRVQTPTLAMIVERDNKVKNFVKEKYYTIELNCRDEKGSFTAVSVEKYDSEEKANELAYSCNDKTANVTNVNREVKTVNPPKLYDLTTLQREANRIFGYTAQQTLDYTQSLYEKKLCTYPRTDSQHITEDMENTAAELVKTVCEFMPFAEGIKFQPNAKRLCNNAKVSDHTALLPTVQIRENDLSELPKGERDILNLISSRLIFATAAPHKYEAVKADIKCADIDFTATGKTVIEDGWKEFEQSVKAKIKSNSEKSDKENEAEEKALPELADSYSEVTAESKEHWTAPPKPFTEDTLLSAMEHAGQENYDDDTEKKGIGTPATRAGTIEGLVKNGYVVREKKQLSATEKGIALIEVVPEEIKSPKMTADWETELQLIEKGKSSESDFMTGIKGFVTKLCKNYSTAVTDSALSKSHDRNIIGVCPKCGKNVVEFPKSFSCESGKGGCGFVIWKNKADKAISEKTAREILSKGKSSLIKGFKSKSGNTFDAYLKLDANKEVVFDFPPRDKK